ncbi:anthranilate synthase component I [Listeria ivanovii]|uniref:anthranilate synthase component I n=2 Tax=Listeria ivanovii TaxID=1638 RepID=UPI000DAA54CF|nr:anthranilate synthase component I [Listeria ivanovii]PZF89041.1 anthranilate synthase component I [Listeria ivanovii]PZF94271.1 anthranilate synthase component I [Listeria ivanovii]PZG04982.1 anthranilate synthase component I [Listeria ivanovii]PZG09443.1 anthranilate synthase component I [Listeria ivanovii]PZG26406.1 anthranilate synthase component I [Listeria ivanovii]
MRKFKKMDADTLTAILAFQRLEGQGKSLLEGAAKDVDAGRYSIIAVNPVHEIKVYQNDYYLDGKHKKVADPLKEMETFIQKAKVNEIELPLDSGAIGYVGYDVIALYEDLGTIPTENRDMPDIRFYVYETFVIIDHQAEELILVQDNCYSGRSEAELEEALQQMEQQLVTPKKREHDPLHVAKMTYKSNYTKQEYIDLVQQAKRHIQEGDFFQVVLSQRLEADFTTSPFDYYRKLRLLNPSPYLYFIDFGDTVLIGSSPESLIKTKGQRVITNPIAGTRKRGATKQEDEQLAAELLADEKELAEHRMLVDLGRNDIGKIAVTGSVEVPVYLTIERYRFLMHLVSVVEGTLKPELTAMDALRSTLPAGTVSGAPKIRAMQRIYEWENVKRGPYAGAVGYLTKNGDCDFALSIRTMVLHAGKAYVQAGAGIVYDSDPESEYLETLQKAKALLEVGE